MFNKKNFKKIKTKIAILDEVKLGLARFLLKSWFFTVVFLFISLALCVLVWWRYLFNPRPSPELLEQMRSEKKDYGKMSKEIEGVLEQIEKRGEQSRVAPDDYLSEREFFVLPVEPKRSPGTKSGSGPVQ